LPVKIIFTSFTGTHLVIAGKHNTEKKIIKIDISDYSQESDILDFDGSIEALSGDGRYIAYFFIEKNKRCFGVYDVIGKKMIAKIPEWSRLIRGRISFSPDGKSIAMGTVYSWPHNGEIRIFDVHTGKCIKKLNAPLKIAETLSKLFSY
jgi:WD40 repeat protein